MSGQPGEPGFDPYARDYEQALGRGLDLTGESRDFYARGRVEIVAATCARLGMRARTICDYGCGTGDTLPLLQTLLGAERLLGLEPSRETLAEAQRRHALAGATWTAPDDPAATAATATCDLVYCNGVFHHIPPAERLACARQALALLRPGGLWFFWENNPYNPGTRWVMSRIPFDRDAITLRPGEARALGEQAGGTWVGTSYHFYFPKFLRGLRNVEPWLRSVPLGGQYVVVLRKN